LDFFILSLPPEVRRKGYLGEDIYTRGSKTSGGLPEVRRKDYLKGKD
jgi:hypothetical protein